MKRWIAIAILAGAGLSASGVVLQEWTFDEVAGKGIHELSNSGTPGDGAWGWGSTDEFVTDGAGNLNMLPGTGGYKAGSFPTALAGSDTYSFEVTSGPWNAVAGSVQLQSKLGSAVEIYTQVNATEGLNFTFKVGGIYQGVNVDSALSGTNEHTARIDFNIDAGTAAFFVDDVDVTGSWLTLTGITFDNASGMIWQKSGDFATADPATVLKISSQSLSIAGELPAPTATELYNLWLADYTMGSDTNLLDDADGDRFDNLTEYAYGGDPSDSADQGNTPVSEGGASYLMYVHYELDDAAARGLAYTPEAATDLVATNWADASGYETGRGAAPGIPGFNAVTNQIPTTGEDVQFIQLQIEFTP